MRRFLLVLVLALHCKDRAFVIGRQQAAGASLVCIELCQRLVRIAEDGAVLIAFGYGDEFVA